MNSSSVRSKSFHNFRAAGLLAVALLGATLAGCLIMNSETSHVTGKKVTAEQLAQVQPGATKEAVVDLLGVPTSTTALGNGLDVWEWKSTQNENKSSGFIFLYTSDKTTQSEQSVSVEFKDGVVTKSWTTGK